MGLEPTPPGLKVRNAADYTTTPCSVGRMRFNRVNIGSLLFLGPCQVVALRIELGATWLSAAFGPPALGYRNFSPDGGTRTCVSVLPQHVGSPLPYIPSSPPIRTAGFEPAIACTPSRRDTQASPRSATSGSCGSRTRRGALEGRILNR